MTYEEAPMCERHDSKVSMELRTMHSELGQGFHFAKPLPTSDMDAILAPVPAAELASRRDARAA